MTDVLPEELPSAETLWRLGDPYPDGWVPSTWLRPAMGNPRRGDVAAIASSIEANGWFGALIVQRWSDRQDGPRILVGNHRFEAGVNLGMERFPVIWYACDDTTGDRILVADNRFAEMARWDDADLIAMLQAVGDLDGTGFTDTDLELLLASLDTMLDGDGDGEAEGRQAGSDVRIQVGTISFAVTREEWDAFESRLVATVGVRHEDHVRELREMLGL